MRGGAMPIRGASTHAFRSRRCSWRRLEPGMDWLVVADTGRLVPDLDPGESPRVSAAAHSGPLGLAVRDGRNALGPAKIGTVAAAASHCAGGAQRPQRRWIAVPDMGSRRVGPVDDAFRSGRSDGGQALVSRPHGAAVRRRQFCRGISSATNRSMKSPMFAGRAGRITNFVKPAAR
jgi:hypothetical protein